MLFFSFRCIRNRTANPLPPSFYRHTIQQLVDASRTDTVRHGNDQRPWVGYVAMFLECENISFILAFDCLWNYANIGIIPEGFCSLFQLFWWHSRFWCPLLNVQLVDEEISWKENQWNSMKFLRIRQFSIQLHIIINIREKRIWMWFLWQKSQIFIISKLK